ncbi:MAG: Aminopeptidase S (Leu, Val, Phe, Tyr preference) [uncultured Solirubrobacteraceae bacterium]|uniref:Aminopeptidase S (Leu, Val, Phe, Tyr preference) n=1 Tax=uncultured Solirubrobacteraceae bacterium TaxID=1162706 RepID=A0A6J4RD08_9ACTN|nr:MAG: Aminopeptidase S (Leu, Val, Phe, Tyr preference) [uncultured Solirubrobacteraceae bacterium]
MDAPTLERFADLIVGFGANVQPDQIVSVACEPGKEALVRAIAASAYRRGARFVDISWFDPWVKRARIEFARDETLDFVPPWYGERVLTLGDQRAARIALSGPVALGLLADLDPVRAGRDRLPAIKESGQVVNDRTTNWTIAPCPTPEWARLAFPDLSPEAGLERLERELLHVCRLDEEDPIAAWRSRADRLVGVAERLTQHRFDAIHYEGAGTDLTVGLLRTSTWQAARFETVDGIEHMPNVPTEEVFTSPDPERADGHVTSTKPLVLIDGTVVRGLRVSFERGRAVSIDADEGAETLRTVCATDAGGTRLGEVALVDGEGRIGALDTIFYDTLLDENAASHIAFGRGFEFVVQDQAERALVNQSVLHIDFMIGSPEMTVTGITTDGERVPVLVRGVWAV